MTILDNPFIARIRRNHGLEHATINILSLKFPRRPLVGYSFPGGFILFGDVATVEVREAATEALSRLSNGERHLAIHPNCGTNFLATGFVSGGLAWLGMVGAKRGRDKIERLPVVIALSMLGLIVSQPLGPMIQERLTTSADPQGLTIVDVFPVRYGQFSMHRVVTES